MSNKVKYYVFGGLIGFFTIFLAIAIPFSIAKIRVDQIGVRVKVWSVKRGVVPKDGLVGWHRGIPKVDQWDRYDGTVQTFLKTSERLEKIKTEPIKVRTIDDYDVDVELIIKYILRRGEVYLLRQLLGPGDRYKIILNNEAVDVARSVFGKMGEKDLYDPYERRKRAEEAGKLLAERMKDRYLDIIDVLLLDLRFDPKLDRLIRNRKLAEQDTLVNISKTRAADERGITMTIDSTTEAFVEKIMGDRNAKLTILEAITNQRVVEIAAAADKYMVEKKAGADRYKEERIAAGKLLVRKVNAEGENLKRAAMIGPGGDLIVAMEAARNINLGDISISTQQIDLLDIEGIIGKFGAAVEKKEITPP